MIDLSDQLWGPTSLILISLYLQHTYKLFDTYLTCLSGLRNKLVGYFFQIICFLAIIVTVNFTNDHAAGLVFSFSLHLKSSSEIESVNITIFKFSS